jgi:hypothetical protein
MRSEGSSQDLNLLLAQITRTEWRKLSQLLNHARQDFKHVINVLLRIIFAEAESD